MEHYRKRRMEGRDSGDGLELARSLGRQHLCNFGDQFGGGREAKEGALLWRRKTRAGGRASMDGVLRRLQDRQDSLGARGSEGAAEQLASSQEQLRVGDAGDRWRTHLRVLWQRRFVLLRHDGQGALVKTIWSI